MDTSPAKSSRLDVEINPEDLVRDSSRGFRKEVEFSSQELQRDTPKTSASRISRTYTEERAPSGLGIYEPTSMKSLELEDMLTPGSCD